MFAWLIYYIVRLVSEKSHRVIKHHLFFTMTVQHDLTGQTFGHWLVLERFFPAVPNGITYWLCQCTNCGRVTRPVQYINLKQGVSTNCGCVKAQNLTKHGLSHHPLYDTYNGMLDRCYNPDNPKYHHYGGKGIKVSRRWLGPKGLPNFVKDVFPTYPGRNHSIDRTDPEGPYSPGNFRWITAKEQSRNRQNNLPVFKHNGLTLTLKEWGELTGLGYKNLYERIFIHDWSPEKALSTPLRKIRKGLVDRVFGELRVLKMVNEEYNGKNTSWIAMCSCGQIVVSYERQLLDAVVTSCGHEQLNLGN